MTEIKLERQDCRIYELVKLWNQAKSTRDQHSCLGRLQYVMERALFLAESYKALFYGIKIALLSEVLIQTPLLFLCYMSNISQPSLPLRGNSFSLDWYRNKATFSQMYWIMDILKFAWITLKD